jgi:transcriptional regulator with XRE-family HTH domain
VKNVSSWIRELGRELRRLRVATGVSQGDLAKKIKKSRFTVNKYEHGETAPPVETLARICEVLGATSFVIYGQRFNIELDKRMRQPRSVPKQLRLKLGIVCTTDQAAIVVPSSQRGNRLEVEVRSA